MCGFVGFINNDEDVQERFDVLKKMTNIIKHRGPDDTSYYMDEEAALGFCRLSIIDLEGGRQPIANEEGSKVLIFNGEIYNYRFLREDLTRKGHIFKTASDAEVVLHGYEEYGTEMLYKLRGMFAFIIWDKVNSELFGARDFFGIKPLYFAEMDNAFIFGSEIKGFMAHPGFKKELNRNALENYLSFQYSPGAETFFKNVYKIEPAHYFIYKVGKLEKKRYWVPEFSADEDKDLESWTDEIENVFNDSINAHKVSDVEIGSFLSSGVDSSYVACSANVNKTYTVGFDNGTKYNEISYASELSKLIGVQNKSKVISSEEFFDEISRIQYHMDEPLADPSAIALYFVCKLASADVKVVLSGEGADEIFGGYNIYKEPLELAWYNAVPYPVRRLIGKVASCFPPKRGLNFLVRRGKKLEDRFIGNAYIFNLKERNKLLKKPVGALDPSSLTKPYYDMVSDQHPVTKMQFLDLNMWLAGDILLKADKMSMANSLELRVPFLDKEVMSLASKIPIKYRVNKENTKYALRQAAVRKMPEKWSEKKKLGFPVPIRIWLLEERYFQRVKEAFLSEAGKEFFDTDMLMNLLNDHQKGKADNSRKIWTIYSFLVWHKVYFDEGLNYCSVRNLDTETNMTMGNITATNNPALIPNCSGCIKVDA